MSDPGLPHGHCLTEIARLRSRLAQATAVVRAAEMVLKGFDDGVWGRNVEHDGKPGWAIQLVPRLKELGDLQVALAAYRERA